MSRSLAPTQSGFRKALLAAFAADILFMPFLLPVPVPLSILIFPIWLAFSKKATLLGDHVLPICGGLLALSVFLISQFSGLHLEKMDEAKFINTGLLVFMFFSFAALDDLRYENLRIIYRIFQIYIAFNLLLSLIFIANPYAYFTLRGFWAFDDSDLSLGAISVITRCTGILSDPNNHAVSICAIGALLIAVKRERILVNLATVFASAIIVTTTMSATGFISLVILGGYFFYSSRITSSKATDVMTKAFLFLICMVAMLLVFQLMSENLIVKLAIERLEQSDVNSRFDRWAIIFDGVKIFSSLMIGDGGAIYWQGRMYLPHNGHFHVFFAFGGIVYAIFVASMLNIRTWSKWRDAAFLLILFAGFTVNVGIYEHRFVGIWILLLCAFYEFSRHRHRSMRKKVTQPRRFVPRPI